MEKFNLVIFLKHLGGRGAWEGGWGGGVNARRWAYQPYFQKRAAPPAQKCSQTYRNIPNFPADNFPPHKKKQNKKHGNISWTQFKFYLMGTTHSPPPVFVNAYTQIGDDGRKHIMINHRR